ncbi:phosphatase PAP2 family protein [Sphingomonas glacialis]|uniref:Phosphatase PAP2 family protein n=1 Tax=Sphingomonas glacialis TaxID=658225 RepID=A0A502FK59_9SPHN|nr:phosphatase PAP2 family protein [Sphingomonas glacialis]TPG49791.1 phosphatase PAP2 family protein [Sphingomonas glacialis]
MSKIAKAARKIARADRKATHRAAAHRDTPAVKLAGAASEVADQPPLLLLGVGTIVVGAVLRRPTVIRNGVRMLASEVLATAIKNGIKRSIDRTRPQKAIETGKHHFAPGKSEAHGDTSFPSGHTAGAVAVAGAIAQDVPGALAPAYAAAAGVAAVQMPRGKHYILDTVAGAAVGFVAQKATSLIIRAAEPALVRLFKRAR